MLNVFSTSYRLAFDTRANNGGPVNDPFSKILAKKNFVMCHILVRHTWHNDRFS